MENNKRSKTCKQSMFELNQSYLSDTAQIGSKIFFGDGFNPKLKFGDFILQIDYFGKGNGFCKLKALLRIDDTNCNPNNIYNLVLKNWSNIEESLHYQIKANIEYSILDDIPNEEEEEFAKKWSTYDDGMFGYFTFYFWRQQDPKQEEKILELTDCVINVEQKIDTDDQVKFYSLSPQKDTFRANVLVLAKSSQVIYNMIKDLEQKYSPQSPVDLSKFFEGFSCKHVHMYLCCVYNRNFQFFRLFDILEILKLSIKLDNQGLIQRIMEMKSLAIIVRDQIGPNQKQDCPCYIDNVLYFAKKYNLHKLVLFCELKYFSMSDEQFTGQLKKSVDEFKC
eukprot:TRINITY_DN2392_c0_g1_i3.p1 TRINITY_DN2392_c0_g1~~TRINITY_DN2392_c0_g1_i3.p1  ORF type:complete len:336 (-),score=38.42 TRINITY_DN2392_c0_g1_i3:83-1090(-)